MEESRNWIILAQLLRPQGRKGELLAELHTDFPQRFENNRRVFLAPPDFNGMPSEAREIEVTSHWLPVGKNQGRIVLKFIGIDSISEAEGIAGLGVLVPLKERMPLDGETNYVSDLIGCTVYDRINPVGVIADILFATTPDGLRRLDETAPTLLLVSPEGDELLVPFAKDFLVAVDLKQRRVDMMLPVGLLDVNR